MRRSVEEEKGSKEEIIGDKVVDGSCVEKLRIARF